MKLMIPGGSGRGGGGGGGVQYIPQPIYIPQPVPVPTPAPPPVSPPAELARVSKGSAYDREKEAIVKAKQQTTGRRIGKSAFTSVPTGLNIGA